MRLAETVTFAAGGLDRAAWMRGKPDVIAGHLADATARVLPVWRGKPLFAGDGAGWLMPGHAVLREAAEAPVFLGLAQGLAHFAADISGWEPPAGEAAEPGGFFDATEQHHPALPGGYRFGELRGVMAALPRADAEMAATARAILNWHRSHRFCSSCGAPSAVSEAGWQRRCPQCAAQHFPRTDPVVIMLVTRGDFALLGRSPGWPGGMFSLLAGFVEPGETIEAAVRREVAEETGVGIGQVRYLASQPWPFPASLMIGCAAEAISGEITLDPAELDAALWLSREEIAQVFMGDHPAIRPPREGAIARFLLANWLRGSLD
ncbi:MAG: NAD(+) diphosphatase [Rhodobacteraceae bacterium]|nr:NAD(+) diphosphatase [Paracoccaceae bacterium]MCP5342397.1 NAD(+) diphosphatase [Paracoccaceae bacterium]